MSAPIWDSGNVTASLAACRCDRCNDGKVQRCISIWFGGSQHNPMPRPYGQTLNLCLACFAALQIDALLVFAEMLDDG